MKVNPLNDYYFHWYYVTSTKLAVYIGGKVLGILNRNNSNFWLTLSHPPNLPKKGVIYKSLALFRSSRHPQERNKDMKVLVSLVFTTIYHQCIYSTLMKHHLYFNYNRDTPSMFSMQIFFSSVNRFKQWCSILLMNI